MGDDGRGIFLEIVRRKIVIILRNEGLEEPPGSSRDQPQGARRPSALATLPIPTMEDSPT